MYNNDRLDIVVKYVAVSKYWPLTRGGKTGRVKRYIIDLNGVVEKFTNSEQDWFNAILGIK